MAHVLHKDSASVAMQRPTLKAVHDGALSPDRSLLYLTGYRPVESRGIRCAVRPSLVYRKDVIMIIAMFNVAVIAVIGLAAMGRV